MDHSDPDDHANSSDDWREIEHINRPRGILSPKERAHIEGLLDEHPEKDADAIRQREYRIRQHIYNAFLDFSIVAGSDAAYQPLRELGHKLDEVSQKSDHPHGVYTGVSRLMEMLYATLGSFHPTDDRVTFTTIFRNSISEVLVDHFAAIHGTSIIPQIEYDIYNGAEWDLDEVLAIYQQYPEKYLLPAELEALYTAEKISYDQYRDYSSKMQDLDLENEEDVRRVKDAHERRGLEASITDDGNLDIRWSVDSNGWEEVS